jgi:glucokinase
LADPGPQLVLALDIGGSHVTAALVDTALRNVIDTTRVRLSTDERGDANVILDGWAEAARRASQAASSDRVVALGLAVPAPFDYARGISLMRHKFAALYEQPVLDLLRARLAGSGLESAPIRAGNDADLFALGEWWAGAGRGFVRVIGLTLGTGLGSGFVDRGQIVTSGPRVPEGGEIWNLPYLDGVAEDYVSGGAIAREYAQATGRTESAGDVASRALDGDSHAKHAFATLATHLARILAPLVARFEPECVVVGGNIARAWALFGPDLQSALAPVQTRPSQTFEDAALLGAAALVVGA